MVEPLEGLIGGVFSSVFGSPIIAGLFGLIMLIVIGVALRLSLEGFIVTLLPFILVMSFSGLLPAYVGYGVVILCAFIIFIAFARVMNR